MRPISRTNLSQARGDKLDILESFKNQYANFGVAINLKSVVELRAGYRHNLSSNNVESDSNQSSGLYTLGAGFQSNYFEFDLGLQVSPDSDELGLGLQTIYMF